MTPEKKPRCRIVALNYNGLDLLREFLPSWIVSARKSAFSCGVTVLDNQSSDGSVEFITQNYPDVGVYRAAENKVLCSYNEIARVLEEEILIFINNDIRTEPGLVEPLIKPFLENKNVFFTATDGDRSIPGFRWGVVSADIHYAGSAETMKRPGYAFSAGIAAFDRLKFLELGGYDPLYLPGYYEDVDLCCRAWKRGYVGVYAPESKKFHVGSVSFDKKFKFNRRQRLVYRNSLLFMVKNITDFKIAALFLLCLPWRFLAAGITGKWFVFAGFFDAIKKIPEALASRRRVRHLFRRKDCEVFNMILEDVCGK